MGQFQDDEKMPRFSVREGEAAVAYLDIEMSLADARKHRLPDLTFGYHTLTIKEGERKAAECLAEFLRAVEEETQNLYPDAAEHARKETARQRARDILRCHRDTSYIGHGH